MTVAARTGAVVLLVVAACDQAAVVDQDAQATVVHPGTRERGVEIVANLLPTLEDGGEEAASTACVLLIAEGRWVVLPLMEALGRTTGFDSPMEFRFGRRILEVAQGLGEQAVPGLREALTSGTGPTREATQALISSWLEDGGLEDLRGLLPELLERLGEREANSGGIISCLAAFGPDVVLPLLEWAATKDEWNRSRARSVFGRLGVEEMSRSDSDRIVQLVREACASDDEDIRELAKQVLGPVSPRHE